MFQEYEKQKQAHRSQLRKVREYSMGGMFLLAGLFFLLRSQFSLEVNLRFPPDLTDRISGAVCLLYGGWRIYRGTNANP
jgi:threonine/homoserine/homoserine lactone efflux protein